MTEFHLIGMDALRLATAVTMAIDECPLHPKLEQRVKFAMRLTGAAKTAEELLEACKVLREIYKQLIDREVPDDTPDTTQSERSTSIRYSGGNTDWKRDGVDNPNIGP